MPLFDTHAHLDDQQLCPSIDWVLTQAERNDVSHINSIGTSLSSSLQVIGLAERFEQIFATVGIHPNYCQDALDSDWDTICELVGHQRVIAVGETGLDRYRDYCPIERQRKWFERHIELSSQIHKPLVIHVRESEDDLLEVLQQHQSNRHLRGIWHSCAGSWSAVKKCLDWGLYISFSGILTYKRSEEIRQIAAKVPADRLLIETDAPYLSPHPFRSTRPNHPGLLVHTAQCLAEVRKIPMHELAELASENARQVFRLNAEFKLKEIDP